MNNISASISSELYDSRTKPAAIVHFGESLNSRQQGILDQLTEYGSRVVVDINDVDMLDLAAFTAVTGDEFALFRKEDKHLIVRGNKSEVNIDANDARQLNEQRYKWVGHTHPGFDCACLTPSDGDYYILECFDQESSVIYNSLGERQQFYKEESIWVQKSSTNSKILSGNTAI